MSAHTMTLTNEAAQRALTIAKPERVWRVGLAGNVPLTFFDEKAMRARVKQLRRAGHRRVEVWSAPIGPWSPGEDSE